VRRGGWWGGGGKEKGESGGGVREDMERVGRGKGKDGESDVFKGKKGMRL